MKERPPALPAPAGIPGLFGRRPPGRALTNRTIQRIARPCLIDASLHAPWHPCQRCFQVSPSDRTASVCQGRHRVFLGPPPLPAFPEEPLHRRRTTLARRLELACVELLVQRAPIVFVHRNQSQPDEHSRRRPGHGPCEQQADEGQAVVAAPRCDAATNEASEQSKPFGCRAGTSRCAIEQ